MTAHTQSRIMQYLDVRYLHCLHRVLGPKQEEMWWKNIQRCLKEIFEYWTAGCAGLGLYTRTIVRAGGNGV